MFVELHSKARLNMAATIWRTFHGRVSRSETSSRAKPSHYNRSHEIQIWSDVLYIFLPVKWLIRGWGQHCVIRTPPVTVELIIASQYWYFFRCYLFSLHTYVSPRGEQFFKGAALGPLTVKAQAYCGYCKARSTQWQFLWSDSKLLHRWDHRPTKKNFFQWWTCVARDILITLIK